MYPALLAPRDDARPRGDSSPSQGTRSHADGDRPPRERQSVDDREDREEANESLVRRRPADHEHAPSGDETAGEEGARGPDPDAEGPIRRSSNTALHRGGRDAPVEVLANARHAQRPSRRV